MQISSNYCPKIVRIIESQDKQDKRKLDICPKHNSKDDEVSFGEVLNKVINKNI